MQVARKQDHDLNYVLTKNQQGGVFMDTPQRNITTNKGNNFLPVFTTTDRYNSEAKDDATFEPSNKPDVKLFCSQFDGQKTGEISTDMCHGNSCEKLDKSRNHVDISTCGIFTKSSFTSLSESNHPPVGLRITFPPKYWVRYERRRELMDQILQPRHGEALEEKVVLGKLPGEQKLKYETRFFSFFS